MSAGLLAVWPPQADPALPLACACPLQHWAQPSLQSLALCKLHLPVVAAYPGLPPGSPLPGLLQLTAERIYWDQATVLAQLGLLDPIALPVTGVEQAEKAADLGSHLSNQLMTK